MITKLICLISILLLLPFANGLPTFTLTIPNGYRVPDPCVPGGIWLGVGHLYKLGGGQLNVFGKDYKIESYKWSRKLCETDSDNDGLTNGYELGDPDCQWSAGETPSRTTNITHPGIPAGSCDAI